MYPATVESIIAVPRFPAKISPHPLPLHLPVLINTAASGGDNNESTTNVIAVIQIGYRVGQKMTPL
jgi:hypothetical protein